MEDELEDLTEEQISALKKALSDEASRPLPKIPVKCCPKKEK